MANPDAGLLSPASDIAFVTNLLNFAGLDVKERLKFRVEDTWQALDNLVHDPSLKLALMFATPAVNNFRAEEREGLAAVICKLEAAISETLRSVQ